GILTETRTECHHVRKQRLTTSEQQMSAAQLRLIAVETGPEHLPEGAQTMAPPVHRGGLAPAVRGALASGLGTLAAGLIAELPESNCSGAIARHPRHRRQRSNCRPPHRRKRRPSIP